MSRYICFTLLFLACMCGGSLAQLGGQSDFGNELGSLPFSSIIGGPFRAVVEAQATAATTTVQFVTEVGFRNKTDANGLETTEREVIMLEYLYEGRIGNTTTLQRMQVPFLTMLPIPFINVDQLKIDFNVQLQSTVTRTDTQTTDYRHTSSGKYGWWSRTSWSGSYSTQSERKSTGQEKRVYKLNVKVRARQAGLPRGAERMLDLMESLVSQNLPRL